MVNWMSDEDAALDSGDAYTCKHCGAFVWVDEHHSCAAGAEASRQQNEAFNKNYFGDGATVTTEVTITITHPNTEMAKSSALEQALFMEGSGEDDVLGIKWTYQEKKL